MNNSQPTTSTSTNA